MEKRAKKKYGEGGVVVYHGRTVAAYLDVLCLPESAFFNFEHFWG
jgi:hypothetical protein